MELLVKIVAGGGRRRTVESEGQCMFISRRMETEITLTTNLHVFVAEGASAVVYVNV